MNGSYPHRILGTGAQNGFSLMLYLNPDDLDYLCQGPVEGFKVVLHAPAEIPLPSKNFFRVPLEQVWLYLLTLCFTSLVLRPIWLLPTIWVNRMISPPIHLPIEIIIVSSWTASISFRQAECFRDIGWTERLRTKSKIMLHEFRESIAFLQSLHTASLRIGMHVKFHEKKMWLCVLFLSK